MNSDQLNLFDYASGASVSVAATSVLSNGNREILEVHILYGERMGILVSFWATFWPRLKYFKRPGSRYHLDIFPDRCFRLTACHRCSCSSILRDQSLMY